MAAHPEPGRGRLPSKGMAIVIVAGHPALLNGPAWFARRACSVNKRTNFADLPRRVLVLDAQSRAAPEVVLSLGRAGCLVDIASSVPAPIAGASRHVVRRLVQPSRLETGVFERWLRELDASQQYQLVVPASDDSMLGIAALAEFDDVRRRAVIPGNEALRRTLDKQSTWELAASLGIEVPASRVHRRGDDPAPAAGFPAVLKPQQSLVRSAEGYHKLFVEIARNEGERRQALARLLKLTNVQEQTYVGGRGVGVECLYEGGRCLWTFVHERLHEYPLTGGGSSYRRSLPPDAACLQPALALLDALGWHGVAMVEFKRTHDGRLVLMEINPRLWGSLALPIACGVDFPAGLLQIACGASPGTQPDYAIGYRARNVEADVLWTKANLRADRSDPLLLTQNRVAALIEWLRPLLGRESWDYFRWNDLGPTRAMLAEVIGAQWTALAGKARRLRLRRQAVRRHADVMERALRSRVGRVVFVCYGNICRSPFAAALALRDSRFGGTVSLGLHEREGRSSPSHIVALAKASGIDLEPHRSRRLDPGTIREDDLIVAMDLDNYRAIGALAPRLLDRTCLLGLFDPQGDVEIADPYALETPAAAQVMLRIARSTSALVSITGPVMKPLPGS